MTKFKEIVVGIICFISILVMGAILYILFLGKCSKRGNDSFRNLVRLATSIIGGAYVGRLFVRRFSYVCYIKLSVRISTKLFVRI